MRHVKQLEARPSGLRQTPKGRRKPQLMTVLLVGLVVLVVLNVAVIVLRPWSDDTAAVRPAGPVTRPTATTDVGPLEVPVNSTRLGLFNAAGPAQTLAFRKWLGRPIKDVVDFGPRETWSDIADPSHVVNNWDGTQYRLIYAVPMLPNTFRGRQVEGVTAGGTGEFNRYFRQLAERLVAAGHEDAVLRIGWEFNLESWAWGVPQKDAPKFVAFWRQIVKTMRAVPGQKFDFNWNVNNSYTTNDGVRYWPGDKWVTSVGVDAYDIAINHYGRTKYHKTKQCNAACRLVWQQKAWNEAIFGGERGLRFWTQFAAAHKKPMSLPEWALWDRTDGQGGTDNAYFVEQMHAYIAFPGNNVEFAAYFNHYNVDGTHVLGPEFPQGTKAFKRLFGKQPKPLTAG